MPHDFDFLVLGAGPAGLRAAVEASELGKRVCVVEKAALIGGAGLHTGTVPSKTLRETALYYSGFLQRGLYGVDFSVPREQISVAKFMVRKTQVLAAVHDDIRRLVQDSGVKVVHGAAEFVDPHRVLVRGANGETQEISSEFVLVATGTSPRHPPGFPFEDPDVVDSDSILELDRIPESLTVLGGGVIGCEYASIFAALGVPVTVIEGRNEILGNFDLEITRLLRERMEHLGVRFLFGDGIERIVHKPGPGVEVHTTSGATWIAGKVLIAAGRTGNIGGLGLEKIGVRVDDRQHVVVDAEYRTSVPNVFAAGDVLGFPALASTGMEQGRLAALCAFGCGALTELEKTLPYGLYTVPEASSFGLSEEEARAKNLDFEIGRAWYRENPRGQIVGDVFGLLKLVFDRPTRRILGVHIVGEKATELVHIGQAVMELGGTLDYFTRVVMNFPTLSVLYKRAAHDGLLKLRPR